MRASWIKDHWQWVIGIAFSIVGIIISLVLSAKPPAIDAEKLAKELAKHLPDQQSLSKKEEMIRGLEETIKNLQQDPADELKQKALVALSEDDKAGATKLLVKAARARTEKAERLNKQAAQDWIDIGNIAYLYDTQKALEAYKKAVTLDPANPNGWNRLGYTLSRLGRLNGAQEAYEKVLGLAGENKSWEGTAYDNLGAIYITRGELERAEKYYRKGLEIDEALGRKKGMAIAYSNLGAIYITRGELDQAEEYCRKGLEIDEAIDRKEGMADDYVNLGLVYQTRGELDRAEEYYRKALEINEALGRKEGLANTFGNLGLIYQTRGELYKAEEYSRKALKINEALGRKEGLANAYTNLGLIYQTRGELDRAEEYYRQALKIDEALFRKKGLARAYANLGLIYQTRGELDQAEEYLRKALKINEALGRKEGLAIAYANLGNIYQTRGYLDRACEYWRKSLKLFNEIRAKDLIRQLDASISGNCKEER